MKYVMQNRETGQRMVVNEKQYKKWKKQRRKERRKKLWKEIEQAIEDVDTSAILALFERILKKKRKR